MPQPYSNLDETRSTSIVSICTGPLLWLLALAGALIVYQQTGNLLCATAIPFCQAAAKPLRCGAWLLSVDPDRSRGRACFAFYLALAFWLAALSALVSFAILMWATPPNGQPPLDQLVITMLTMFGGALLGSIAATFAAILAFRSKVRIWVHPSLRDRCGGDFDRLIHTDLRENYLSYLVALSLIYLTVVIGSGIMTWLLIAVDPNGDSLLFIVVITASYFVGPFVMLVVSAFLCARIGAKNSAQCWEYSQHETDSVQKLPPGR